MIHQSILIPATPKTLTRVGLGTTFTVAPGIVMSATADSAGTGTYLSIRNQLGAITREHVTIPVATFILGTTFIPVTSVGGATKYIRAETISSYEPSLGGTQLQLLSDDTGNDQACTLVVTQSVATISAAIAAALATVDPSATVTVAIVAAGTGTQGTAAAVTSTAQNVVVSITGGAAGTAIILATATAGQKRTIINATATTKTVYPAVGGFFLDQRVNEGITIGAYEAVDIYSDSSGKWAREENSTIQTVAGSGSIQGGGVIANDTETVLFTPSAGNTACTLPTAVPGKVVRIQNISATVVGRVFPASGANINGGTVNVHISLAKSGMVTLTCNVAGAWVDASVQQTKMVVDTISPVVGGGGISFDDPTSGQMALLNAGVFQLLTAFKAESRGVTAEPGGAALATQVTANLITIETCAAVGDGILLMDAGGNFRFIMNVGAQCASVYGPPGVEVNGVVDGFASVNPGSVAIAVKDTYTSLRIYELGGANPGSYTANPGGGQVGATLLRNEVAVVSVCATAGDSVIINDQYRDHKLVNSGVADCDVFPPVGHNINLLAPNAAFSATAGSLYAVFKTGVTNWAIVAL